MERKISCITTYRADMGSFENTALNFYKYKEVRLNSDGKTIREAEFQSNGKPYSETLYRYDGKGNLLEKEVIYKQEETSEKITYSYDEQNNITEEAQYYDGELYERTLYKRNDKGKPVEQCRLGENGEVVEKISAEYNDRDLISRQLMYQGDELERETEYEYDEEGQCILEKTFHVAEDRRESLRFEYNDRGKKIKSEIQDQEANPTGQVEVEYDEEDRPVKYYSETLGFDTTKVINQITYDDQGRVIENEYYDVLNGYLISRESTVYDEDGNIREEEVFEITPSAGKKTHYKLQLSYEYEEVPA